MSIQALDKSTVRNIHSGQVIVDIESIVKELVENSLDASATFIELKLIDHGLHSIQARTALVDNGRGIEENDRANMAKHHYTSKIRNFQDLESIDTFGFRGEALHSICSICKSVSVTTKTKKDHVPKKYDVGSEGNLLNEEATNTIVDTGTIISIVQPFIHLPVRRQVAQKNATASVKKIQELLIKYALVYPSVRFAFHNTSQTAGKPTIWIKPPTTDVEEALSFIYGSNLSNMLEHLIETDKEQTSLTVDILVPKKNSDPSVILKGGDRIFFYVNQRPINYVKSELKDLVTTIRNRYREYLGLGEAVSAKKTPFVYVHIQLSPDTFDVNVEPNKTAILFHDKQKVINIIESLLEKLYPTKIDSFFQPKNNAQEKTSIIEKENNPKSIMNWQISPSSQPSNDTIFSAKKPVSLPREDNSKSSRPPLVDLTSNTPGPKKIQTSLPSPSSNLNPFKPVTSGHTSKAVKPTPVAGSSRPIEISKQLGASSVLASSSTSSISALANKDSTSTPTNTSSLVDMVSTVPKSVLSNPDVSTLKAVLQKHSISNTSMPSTSQPISSTKSKQPAHSPNAPSKPSVHLPNAPFKPPAYLPSKQPTTLLETDPQETPRKRPRVEPPKETRNESVMIHVDLDSIKANYALRRDQMSQTYHISIEDYLTIKLEGQEFIRFIPFTDQSLFFVRGVKSREDERIHKMNQIGVLKYKEIQKYWIMKELIDLHKLTSHSKLDRPVQVQFNTTDPLCASLLSLACREKLVADDSHGQKDITYKEITDQRIVQNGFQVRWRKEPHLDRVLVQFTSIYPLGTSYGPGDFRELLSNLNQRPTKILRYLESMAREKLAKSHGIDHARLQETLAKFQWQTMTGSNWKLGLLDSTIMACMLVTE
ncbi:hypothetical protein G6F56_000833 [Rhizopus delemar]|nr:hypothetical protein G6F56_000833 [Rhizopus delemar]